MHALSKFLPNDFDPAGGLTLLSGKGAYPRLVAERARAAGMDVSLIAIVDEVDPEFVETFPRERVLWAKVGQLGKFLSNLEKLRSRYFIMAGQVAPKRLFQGLVPDLKAALILARLKERNAHTIFGAVADEAAKIGVTQLDARAFMDDQLASAGTLAGEVCRRLRAKNPLDVPAETFNRETENYCRENLRRAHFAEGAETARDLLGESAGADFMRNMDAAFDGNASPETLRALIAEMLRALETLRKKFSP